MRSARGSSWPLPPTCGWSPTMCSSSCARPPSAWSRTWAAPARWWGWWATARPSSSAPPAAPSARLRPWPAAWPLSPCRRRSSTPPPATWWRPSSRRPSLPCASSSRCCAPPSAHAGTTSCAWSAKPRAGCCTRWRRPGPRPERQPAVGGRVQAWSYRRRRGNHPLPSGVDGLDDDERRARARCSRGGTRRGGPMSMQGWHAMRSLTKDDSVKDRRLAPGTSRRVLGYARPYRREIVVFVALVVATPLLLRKLIDEGVTPRNRSVVIELSLLVAALAVAEALLTLVQRYYSARIGEGLVYDLRTQVFAHVLRQPIAF